MFNRTVPLCLGDPVFINEYRRVIDANTARNYGKCASWCVFGKLRNLFARGKYRGTSREGDDWTVLVNV